ncbi:MAG: nitroreductase [Nitrospirota bacterium]|nr:nitroreductase [Nitrospirota bacterium]
MDVVQAMHQRKSIRGFLPTPVPKEVIVEVLEAAVRAPSSENIQPWKFYVLGGKVLETLKDKVMEQIESGKVPEPEFPTYMTMNLPQKYRSRMVELGKALFGLAGIERHDMEGRRLWYSKMMRFFEAPNAIVITVDEEISTFSSIFSIGCVTMAIALAALPFGLGTCIQHAGVLYPDVIREVAKIPKTEKIVMSIAIGYPDPAFKANRLVSPRVPLEEVATFLGVSEEVPYPGAALSSCSRPSIDNNTTNGVF